MSQDAENTAVAAEPLGNAGKDHAHAREARRLVAAKLPGEAGTMPDETGREKLCADFREYLVALKRSPNTVFATMRPLTPFFAFLDGRGLDLRAAALRDMEAYKIELQETGRYTAHSIDTYLRAVRRFYAWMERTGKVLVNPTDGLPFPRVKDALPRTVLTPTEMRKLLNAPDTSTPLGIRDKTMLEVFYSTGIRLAELCALTVYDVDVIAGYARVNAGKGNKDRVVPMGRKACDYLKDYLRHVRGRFTRNRRDERALFVGPKGRKIHFLIVERLIRGYARTAGIKKRVTPHALRHTCATHMIQGGADVSHVQRLLGHARLTSTQIYTRVAAQDVKATHALTHPRESDEA